MDKHHTPSVLLPAVSTGLDISDADFFWEQHWKKFGLGLIAVVLAILVVGAWAFYRSHVRSSAAAAYAAAHAPEQWREVIAQFPGSTVAGNAELRLAAALRAEGKLGEAAEQLGQFLAAQPDHPLAGAAELTLGGIRQLEGNTSAALEAYRVTSERHATSYAAPLALLAEASLLEAQGKPGESRAVLTSIGTSYPETPAAMVSAAQLAAISRQAPAAASNP